MALLEIKKNYPSNSDSYDKSLSNRSFSIEWDNDRHLILVRILDP